MTGSVSDRFDEACAAEATAPDVEPELFPTRLARACATVLPVDGAGISLFDGDFRVPLGASSAIAGFAERLQFTQGEGPCLEAAARGRPLIADMATMNDRWPALAAELAVNTPFRAIIALPMRLSPSVSAALDLYLVDPDAIAGVSRDDAAAIGEAVTVALLNAEPWEARAGSADSADGASGGDGTADGTPDPAAWVHTPAAEGRQLVWVAMGMIMTTNDVDADDALALLRGYSYSHGLTVDGAARGLVRGDISLTQVSVG